MSKSLKGFTLAEVLLTLVVVGIVAALTIPSLIQNTQYSEMKTAFKKNYSDITGATQRILLENGGTFKGLCSDFGDNCFRDLYITYLSYTKKCDDNQSFGNCWNNVGSYYDLDGSTTLVETQSAAGLILNNGAFLRFLMGSQNCTDPSGSLFVCGFISIDVNGFRGPNRQGRDIFYMHVMEDRVAPWGTYNDNLWGWSCANGLYGRGCAAKVLLNKNY